MQVAGIAALIESTQTNKPMQRFRTAMKKPVQHTHRSMRGLWHLQYRERERLWNEISQVRGLMQLLMKQRNGYRWTDDDKRKIRAQLRQLGALSPYLVLFLAPGGLLALPALAWWLDRRRRKRNNDGRESAELE